MDSRPTPKGLPRESMTPGNDPHESNRAFYDRISAAYDLIADASEHAARATGLKLLDPQPGERALEIGFGTGNDLAALAQRVGSTGCVSGLDISSGMLNVARRKVEAAGLLDRVDLRVGDARRMPFASHSHDLAYSSFTLELFPEDDIPVVLAECRRVLRPGGRLGLVSMARPRSGEAPSLIERAYVWMHRQFPHWVDCRPIDVARVLTNAGFQVTRQETLNIWTMPVVAAVGLPS